MSHSDILALCKSRNTGSLNPRICSCGICLKSDIVQNFCSIALGTENETCAHYTSATEQVNATECLCSLYNGLTVG